MTVYKNVFHTHTPTCMIGCFLGELRQADVDHYLDVINNFYCMWESGKVLFEVTGTISHIPCCPIHMLSIAINFQDSR